MALTGDDGKSLAGGAASGAAAGSAILPGWGTAIGAIAGLGMSAWELHKAHEQKQKADELAGANTRPIRTIPPEILQNLSDAQRMALEGLPEEQKTQYINNIQRSQNFGLSGLSDRKAGLAGLGGIVQGGNDSYNNLLAADSGARVNNQRNLFAARTAVANYKDENFQTNQLNPFYENAAAIRALNGAGDQNTYNGLNGLGQSAQRLGTVYDQYNRPNASAGLNELQ